MYSSQTLITTGGALSRTERNTDPSTSGDGSNSTSCPHLELLRGRDGRDGHDGHDGMPGLTGRDGEIGPPAPRDQLDPLAPLVPLLLILVCRVPLGPLDQRDPPALLDLKAAKAHLDPLANMASLDPLDLQDQSLALVGLFTYAGDEPPVLVHLEHSWCMQEGLEVAIFRTVVEEQTNSVYQIIHST